MQTEVKVGAAVILAAALFVLFMAKVERWSSSDYVGTRLTIDFDTVSGLEPKAPVKVAGVKVGEVASIRLKENGHAEVLVTLYPGVTLHRGAKAAVRATGLLGEKYLELTPGDPNAEPMAESDRVTQLSGSGDVDRLVIQLNSIAEDIKAVSASFRNALGEEEGQRQLKEIVQNIHDFTVALKDRGPVILARLNAIMDKIDSGVGTIGKLVQDPTVYKDLEKSVNDLKQIMDKVNTGDGTLGKMVNDPALYNSLKGAASGVEKITDQAASGKGTIGRLLSDDSTVNSLNSAMQSLGKIGDRMEAMRLFITFRNEFQLDGDKSKGYFALRLNPRANRSYVLEMVDAPQGRVSLRTTQSTTGGVTTTQEDLVTDRRFLFSAMFDQQFDGWGVHGGLMESTAGVGVDVNRFAPLTMILDAWDFDSVRAANSSPHVKATARYQLGQYFFVQGGMDNFLNRSVSTPFVGAGLVFEDEDLKYLLGSAASALN